MDTPLKIALLPVTPFRQNASIVVCGLTNKAALVDPGGEAERFVEAVAELGVTVEKILITHGHVDHAGAATELAEHFKVPIEGPDAADGPLLAALDKQGERFGITDIRPVTPDRFLAEGDTVTVGELSFSVLHVPGHSPGSVVFVNAPAKLAIVGDTLFQGSVGRSDIPGGDHDLLIRGIKEKLLPLGDDMRILPGHGSPSSIGEEKRTNPFLR